MAIRGRIIAIGQMANGISKSKGTPWKKQEFILETSGQYPKKVAFSIMNDKIEQAAIQIGHDVEVEVDAQSREYNGRWYTELTAWKIRNYSIQHNTPYAPNNGFQQTAAPQGYSAPYTPQPAQPTPQPSNDEPLPF